RLIAGAVARSPERASTTSASFARIWRAGPPRIGPIPHCRHPTGPLTASDKGLVALACAESRGVTEKAGQIALRSAIRLMLSFAFLGLLLRPLLAQLSDARDDGDEARHDALLATPNVYTPTPQDNLFATVPGLEQQAPRQRFTANGIL